VVLAIVKTLFRPH